MALPLPFLKSLGGILDEAYAQGSRSGRDLQRVRSQAMAYVRQETAHLTQEAANRAASTNGRDGSTREPDILGVDALPEGWTGKADAWLASLEEHLKGEPADVARAVARGIDDAVLEHRVSPSADGEVPEQPEETLLRHALVFDPPRAAQVTGTPGSSAHAFLSVPAALASADTLAILSTTGQAAFPTASAALLPAAEDDPMDVDVLGTHAGTSFFSRRLLVPFDGTDGAPAVEPFLCDYRTVLPPWASLRRDVCSTWSACASPPGASLSATAHTSEPAVRPGSPTAVSLPSGSRAIEALKIAAARCGRFDVAMALSHVCAPLRTGLVRIPEVWTHPRVYSAPSPDVLEGVVDRSASDGKRRLLSLDIVLRRPSDLELLLGPLVPALRRTRHPAISAADQDAVVPAFAVQRLLQSPASPDLASLWLKFHSPERPDDFFRGTSSIRTLACPLSMLLRVDRASLALVREFVALRPHPMGDQSSHAGQNFYDLLPNAGVLVLDHAFIDRKRKREENLPRLLDSLVLDQRTGLSSWEKAATIKTLGTTLAHLVGKVIVICALETTAKIICENLSNLRCEFPERQHEFEQLTRLAVLVQGGQLHCALASIFKLPRRHYFLDVSASTLGGLRIGRVVHLTLAAHLPAHALLCALVREPMLESLTVWVNPPAPNLESLLTFRDGRLGEAGRMQKIKLVAACPTLPAVCRRLMNSVPPRDAQCTVAVAQLLSFIAFQGWVLSNLCIVLGDGVELEGDQVDLQILRTQARKIERVVGPPEDLL